MHIERAIRVLCAAKTATAPDVRCPKVITWTLVAVLPAFVAAAVIVSAPPGPGFALVVRRTALRGRAYGFAAIIGLEVGLYSWALLVASGAAVVALSEVGFLVLKVVGCSVLAYLAIRSFMGGGRSAGSIARWKRRWHLWSHASHCVQRSLPWLRASPC